MAHVLDEISGDSGIPVHESPLLKLLTKALTQFSSRPAVGHERAVLTYADIDKKSIDLARMIDGLRLPPQSTIAVCLLPGLDAIVALLGVLRAGMVYMPLDPKARSHHLRQIIEKSVPSLILIQRQTETLSALKGIPSLLVDVRDLGHHVGQVQEGLISSRLLQGQASPAALFFTSGLSGGHKAVFLSHENLAFFLTTVGETYKFVESDTFLALSGLASNMSLFDLLCPWLSGGQVFLLTREKDLDVTNIAGILDQISVMYIAPGLLRALFFHLSSLAYVKNFTKLRYVLTGGDVVAPFLIEKMKIVFPNASLFVLYGCTEITGLGTSFPIPRDTKVTTTLIGRPFKGVHLLIVDDLNREVYTDSIGEICISSQGIAGGYLDPMDKTIDCFTTSKSLTFLARNILEKQKIYFRTGDLGRLGINGHVEFLGRRDHQIYSRGIAVEFLAMENNILEKGIAQEVALAVKQDGVRDHYIAYVVKPKLDNIRSLREELAPHFSDYMLPNEMVILDKMPYRTDYKIDRNALIAENWEKKESEKIIPKSAVEIRQKKQVPRRDDIESQIMEIFSSILNQTFIGLDEDFFDLGGTSIHAIIALQEMEKKFGAKVRAQDFFRLTTVRKLAEFIEYGKNSLESPFLLNQSESYKKLFMLSGIHRYKDLAAHLTPVFSCYGVFSNQDILNSEPQNQRDVRKIARNYLDIIQGFYPDGPFHLLGHSFGGIIAYEMAQILVGMGKPPESLTMIDTFLPEGRWNLRYPKTQMPNIIRRPFEEIFRLARSKISQKPKPIEQSSDNQDLREHNKIQDELLRIQNINHQATIDYLSAMKPYPGSVLLFISKQSLRSDLLKNRKLGWQQYIADLQVEMIESSEIQSMDDLTFVTHVAERMQEFSRNMGR
jgi:acyl-CoA synthetase (AMP-forming)/AMP-acid ligase II/thioesterase domain-containing protein/acyl carrier protein